MDPKKPDKFEDTLLYRCPGQHNGGNIGGKLRTYTEKAAKSPEELKDLLSDGWSKTLPEAAKAEDAEKAKGAGK